jgi:hypothetical protein
MKLRCRTFLLGLLLIGVFSCSDIAQKADPDFIPKNTKNSFLESASPRVLIDEAHHNFHTIKGRYEPFTQVLTSDGYTVEPGKEKFTLEYLKQADILVIANALDKSRRDYFPPYNDAFEAEEIAAVKQWVFQGGSLFLVADHIPFPKVIDKLAIAFGFEFSNGHVDDAMFRVENNTLMEHAIREGAFRSENIIQVKTFGGSAFKIPENAKPLLTLGKGAISLIPDIPFQVNSETPRINIDGWSQGAVLEVGEGRVAVFAEGMMFSSQLTVATGKKYGLTSKGAEQNEQFLLNIMHWLSKKI